MLHPGSLYRLEVFVTRPLVGALFQSLLLQNLKISWASYRNLYMFWSFALEQIVSAICMHNDGCFNVSVERTARMVFVLTAAVVVGPVREAPDVAEPDGEADGGQEEVELP